jgi:hypothetical protein
LLMSAFLLSFLNALPVVSMVAGLLPVSSILTRTLRIEGLKVWVNPPSQQRKFCGTCRFRWVRRHGFASGIS